MVKHFRSYSGYKQSCRDHIVNHKIKIMQLRTLFSWTAKKTFTFFKYFKRQHSKAKRNSHKWRYVQRLTARCVRAFIFLKITLPLLMPIPQHKELITISKTNVPLLTILSEIEKQSKYTFFYNETLKQASIASVDVKDMPVSKVLEYCLKNQPFKYEIIKSSIIIKIKKSG
jgi:hypothetical protein